VPTFCPLRRFTGLMHPVLISSDPSYILAFNGLSNIGNRSTVCFWYAFSVIFSLFPAAVWPNTNIISIPITCFCHSITISSTFIFCHMTRSLDFCVVTLILTLF
jgi:hypothetical protein